MDRVAACALCLSFVAACTSAPPCAPVGIVVVCECSPGVTGRAVCTKDGLGTCDCSDGGLTDGGSLDGSLGGDAGEDLSFDTGADLPLDAWEDLGVDSGGDADTDSGMDSGSDAGADAGTDSGSDAGADSGADAGADAGSDAGTDGGVPLCPPTTWDDTMPASGICSPSGWCLLATALPARWSYSVQSVGSDDTWASTAEGPLLHWNGTAWSGAAAANGTVRVIPSSEVLLQQASQILVWSGTSFGSPIPLPDMSASFPTLRAMWAASSTDIWWVGDVGRVVHWDGASWTTTDIGAGSAGLIAIMGSAWNDVWVTDGATMVRHFDGTAWSDRSFATGRHVLVAAPSGGGGWVAGYPSGSTLEDLRRWNGSGWTSVPLSHIDDDVQLGFPEPGGTILFNGHYRGVVSNYNWNGTTFSVSGVPADQCTPLTGSPRLSQSASYDRGWMFAFGGCAFDVYPGRIDRATGGAPPWAAFRTGTYAHDITPLTSDGDVIWHDAGGAILRGTIGGTSARQTALEGHGWPLHGDVDAGNLWTISATAGSVDHYDGTSWTTSFVHGGTVSDVAATSGHVFALVGGTVYRYTAPTWTAESLGAITSLEESGGDTAYAFGSGTMAYFDGTSWASSSVTFTVACAGPGGPAGELDAVASGGGVVDDVLHFVAGSMTTSHAFAEVNGCSVRNGRAITITGSSGPSAFGREMMYFDGTNVCAIPFVPGETTFTERVTIGPGGRAWRETAATGGPPLDPMLIEWRAP